MTKETRIAERSGEGNPNHSGVRTLLLCLAVCSLAFPSCSERDVAERLDDIDSYISDHPDSALMTLRNIDTTKLYSAKHKAHYSLLHAMALDKNYIDTTDTRIIMPAVKYYKDNGPDDSRLKAYYYLGRIQVNAENLNSAAVSYMLSERAAAGAKDHSAKGLLYMAISDAYNKVRNSDKELHYAEKGAEEFRQAQDAKRYNLVTGRLAMLHYGREEWAVADSLYRKGIERARGDSVATAVFLSNYAKMKVVQPQPDPEEAISLLDEKVFKYHKSLSVMDKGVYAYASALLGDNDTCDRILASVPESEMNSGSAVAFWQFLIKKSRGDYKSALEYFIKSYSANSESIDDLLSHSVANALQEYSESEALSAKQEADRDILRLCVLFLSSVILIGVVSLFYWRKQNRKRVEMERLLRLYEESNRMLKKSKAVIEQGSDIYKLKSESMLGEIESVRRQMEDQQSRYDHLLIEEKEISQSLQEKLDALRMEYAVAYKEKYSAIGELCNAYLSSKNRTDKKEVIYRRVEKLIAYISEDDKLHKRFEDQINKDLDNMITYLREDFGESYENDSRFICYWIVGFGPEMISTILGLSLSNVYTKKSRWRERIKKLDSPHREEYLRML